MGGCTSKRGCAALWLPLAALFPRCFLAVAAACAGRRGARRCFSTATGPPPPRDSRRKTRQKRPGMAHPQDHPKPINSSMPTTLTPRTTPPTKYITTTTLPFHVQTLVVAFYGTFLAGKRLESENRTCFMSTVLVTDTSLQQ